MGNKMNSAFFNIIVQTIGIVGIVASVISFQCKKSKKLLFFKTAKEMLFAVQYCMLGAYTGMSMNLIGSLRNIIFAKMIEKKKNTLPLSIVFSVLFVIFALLTWDGLKSLLSGIAKVLSTIAYGSSNTSFVRLIIFFTSISWLIYNYCVKSYAGCVCEILNILSIIVGFIRIDIPKYIKKRGNENEI